jgi:hypothetical protein
MKWLLVVVLFASCASRVEKTYTTPEIGMSFNQFAPLCDVQGEIAKSTTVTNSKGSTITITLTDTPETYPANRPKRAFACIGTFTFTDGSLTTISR